MRSFECFKWEGVPLGGEEGVEIVNYYVSFIVIIVDIAGTALSNLLSFVSGNFHFWLSHQTRYSCQFKLYPILK
eukprot:scaffold1366_cov155-Skeletonema_menzelii.AAC.17